MTIIKTREIPGFPRNLITRTGIVYYLPPHAKMTAWRMYRRLTPERYDYSTRVQLVTQSTPSGIPTGQHLSKRLFELLTMVWPDDNPFDTQYKLRMAMAQPRETLSTMKDYMQNPVYAYRNIFDYRLFTRIADISAYYMLSRNAVYSHVLTTPSHRRPVRGQVFEEVYTYRQPHQGVHDANVVTYEELFELPNCQYPSLAASFGPPQHIVTEM